MADNDIPAWKRNGRSGPLDWWLACQQHGYDYRDGCMSCQIAEEHNIEFQARIGIGQSAKEKQHG